MPLLPLRIPPGVVRAGTVYDARGAWYDTNLIRWVEGVMQPVGGWRPLKATVQGDVILGGPVRGMHAWRANDGSAHLAAGTQGKLWHFVGGVLADLTPAGFAAGQDDGGTIPGAYGYGAYGYGAYGEGDTLQVADTEAQTWQLDNFGEDLVAVAYSDRRLYRWVKQAGGRAEVITGAPVLNRGVVVTPERFLVALGAGGDERRVQWSDQENAEEWDPVNSQAGDLYLAGSGRILAGRRTRGETLIWTDAGLYAMRYIGGPLVYQIPEVGTGCGAVSRMSMAVLGERAVWMGAHGFFSYEGYVKPLPCSVADYVFGDLNRSQVSKIAASVRSDFSEVVWFYPSAGSKENDRYVSFNAATGEWAIGQIGRTSGVDRGAMPLPLAADAAGRVWEHEVGDSYPAPGGVALVPFAESGPIEIGSGERVMHVRQLVTDERTLGGVRVSAKVATHPTAPEQTHGPFVPGYATDARFTGRLVRLRIDQAAPGWRFGAVKLDVVPGGRR